MIENAVSKIHILSKMRYYFTPEPLRASTVLSTSMVMYEVLLPLCGKVILNSNW